MIIGGCRQRPIPQALAGEKQPCGKSWLRNTKIDQKAVCGLSGKGFFVGYESWKQAVKHWRPTLKQSGMHGTVKDADSSIALRCGIPGNRWEAFWENRVA
jgi:hypothetical protein